ncbi:MAG: hypothetical protein H0W08_16055 [Acidobacteria bacterium]|nr:hypothetical protein [Acidobacteriota bacterium]
MTGQPSTMHTTLSLAFVCLAVAAFRADPAASQDEPSPALLEWRKKVIEAKGLDDETQKREAMVALVREALVGREVRLAGTTHQDKVHQEDNQPAPIVNFDPRLNQKSSAQSRQGTPTRSLQGNFGYYFSYRGAGYVVIGPAALDPRNPVFTRMAAEHELFHAKTHVGDSRPSEARELETWTQMFVTYFHEVMAYNQRWAPMLAYYDDADTGERTGAIDRLATYYRTPPGDDAAKTIVRTAFEEWLARRKKDTAASKLVADLEKALRAGGVIEQ